MVELFEQDIRTNDRQSSKGNQLKWENHGIWHKADYAGYEGLAEFVISHLIGKSTLSPDEYVCYELEEIKYKSTMYHGAQSKDFLRDGWQIVTLERLFQIYFGKSLYQSVYKIENHEKRLIFLVNQVERITGLSEFGKYMNKLLTIDAVFLNEDRHTHNIAVLMNKDGRFAYCPIFDHGAGLLSDTTMDYPMGEDVYVLMDTVRAKTICDDLDEQLDISEQLFHSNIKFYFTRKDVDQIIMQAEYYSEDIKARVKNILFAQMRKYRYLWE